jgi:hypothetical protein
MKEKYNQNESNAEISRIVITTGGGDDPSVQQLTNVKGGSEGSLNGSSETSSSITSGITFIIDSDEREQQQ